MRKRTKARELSLKFLYQVDIIKEDWQSQLDKYWQFRTAEFEVKEFADVLIKGTLSKIKEIDDVIAERAENWKLKRMAIVDRNILRLACFELLYMPDIPSKVSINEGINLAKKYGDVDSGKFVNGILDKVKRDIVDKQKNKT